MMTNEGTDKLKQLRHIFWRVWAIWKDIAIASHLIYVGCQPRNHKRSKIRLFLGIQHRTLE
jgi:hypothetical protein